MNSEKIRTFCPFRVRVCLEQLDQGLELVVVGGLELLEFLEELDDLVQVQIGFVEDFIHLVLIAGKLFDVFEHFLVDDVLIVSCSSPDQLVLVLVDIVEQSPRSAASSGPAAVCRRRSVLCLVTQARSFNSRVSQENSKARAELSKRLRNWVRIRLTTSFWRFSSKALSCFSMSGPM